MLIEILKTVLSALRSAFRSRAALLAENEGFLADGEKVVATSVGRRDSESLGCHFEKPKVLDGEASLIGRW